MVGSLARPGLRRRLLLLSLPTAVVLLALVLALVKPWPSEPVKAEVAAPAAGDHVLQSVDVAMADDGSLSGVDDTVVISRPGGATDSVATTYDPSAVVDDLPVRVLTSYRTEQSAGTRLSDLKGYTGRVVIDLTVQNLTVKPQQVTYDAAGRSRTSTAMVGAPLTVVASAALPGTSASSVVTATSDASTTGDPSAQDETTNGVLSRSADDTTQVQWATILAPPQLDASAALRLVVDARDFTLPSIDLSVQPGLVTDPSLGALVDAAFNPEDSDELALQSRTIKLIGDVNGVLGRASDTIAGVRKTLDTTSDTLGTKTVSSLKSSTESLTTQMKTSRDNLESLDKDLNSSVTATNSATLARMAESVAALDQLLGDTSAKATPAKVTGSGCEQKVAGPGKDLSVYASLLQVSAQLDGYAGATTACKTVLQQTILDSIGPADPTAADACPASATSVTCVLADLQSTFAEVTEKFVSDSQSALDKLQPGDLDTVRSSIDVLLGQLAAISASTDTLLAADPVPDSLVTLANVSTTLTAAQTSLTSLTTAIKGVHDDAVTSRDQLPSMQNQNTALADQLCALVGNGITPGTLTPVKVEQLRSYLTTRSCPDADGNTLPLVPPVGYPAAMTTRLTAQATALNTIIAATDTADETDGAGLPLSHLASHLTTLSKDVTDTRTALTAGDKDLRDKIAALRVSVQTAQTGLTALRTDVGGVKSDYDDVKTELAAALQQSATDANAAVKVPLDDQITRVTKRSQDSSEEVGEMFERSAAGLSATADDVQSDGKRAVQKQRDQLAQTQTETEKSLTDGTKTALAQVSQDVNGATRDLDTTKTLLSKDLANVLLDLGTPKVRGSGVLGSLATSAKAAGSADYQLSLATDKSSAYAAVRSRDVNGIMLRQAQAEAALQRQSELPAFALAVPTTVSHRTVYVFHLAGSR